MQISPDRQIKTPSVPAPRPVSMPPVCEPARSVSDSAHDQLSLPTLASARQDTALMRELGQFFDRNFACEPDVQRSVSTYTSQWEDRQAAQAGLLAGDPAVHARESEANCGAASASMMLKQFGLSAPTMHELRRQVGARLSQTGRETGAFALSTQQVMQAVKQQAAVQGRQLNAAAYPLPANSQQALEQMRERLARNQRVILLSGGFDGIPGHYMVIKAIQPDGTMTVDDPALGPDQTRTPAELQQAMDNRRKAGRGMSQMIVFSEPVAKNP